MRFSGEKKEEDGKLFALLEKMYRQQIRKEYGYELLMQSIFYQLKYLLVTAYRIPEEKKDYYPGNTHSGHLERITGYLREHYAEEISLETLAATLTCRKCSVSMAESTIKIICGASGLNMHCGNWRKRI